MPAIIEFSRTRTPNGGWRFRQPQLNWEAPNPIGNTFDQQVNNIIKVRLKNRAITAKFNLATDGYTVGNELEQFNRLRLGMPPTINQPTSFREPSRLLPQGAVAAAVEGIKKIAAGNSLLTEWEESGQPPVGGEESTKRASRCCGCPKNQPGDLTKWFTIPVAEMIRKKLQRLHNMNLTTTSDDKLFVCSACLCPLKLKVHTPMDLIQKYLAPSVRADLWSECWIVKS